MEYPRTNKIRIGFAVARLAESVFLLWLMVALTQQWIIPHLQNAVETGQDHPGLLLHHLISMAVPNNIIWLIFFVCIFHSWLNFLSEILRFADREFYRDWWNAQDVQYFWAAWNIPIHKWCVRHMYKPMLRSGYSKGSFSLNTELHVMHIFLGFVSFCVFAFSAVFHEVMVSVPLQRLRFYSFLGMVAQVPLQPITACKPLLELN